VGRICNPAEEVWNMPSEWSDLGPFILDNMFGSLSAGLQIRPTENAG